MKISSAILSVADKSGLCELAAALCESGANLFATGGTAKVLADNELAHADVSVITGDAEMLGGRVKTLNSNLHAAVLSNLENPAHAVELKRRGVPEAQLVVVNFYPFGKVVKGGASESEAVENVDIGGPALARAAAKGGRAVLSHPEQYAEFIAALKQGGGEVSEEMIRSLRARAFAEVARLDGEIANYFARKESARSAGEDATTHPERVFFSLRKTGELRYGENPHQRAACYAVDGLSESGGSGESGESKGWREWVTVSGGGLSYNNILDAQSAWRAVLSAGEKPAAVIVKHNNPCGGALAETLCEAFDKARRGDPLSAYGGVAALNREVDAETARALAGMFLEVVVAPGFSDSALETFAGKERPRLALAPETFGAGSEWRIAEGTALWQVSDDAGAEVDFEIHSKRKPTAAELSALRFAWRMAAALKSNAIALARGEMLAGVGAGQSSRVDAARLARDKMARADLSEGEKGAPLVAASDGFFPFADGARVLLEAGAVALAHPGGAKRDDEIARAGDEFGAVVAVAGRRHFRH